MSVVFKYKTKLRRTAAFAVAAALSVSCFPCALSAAADSPAALPREVNGLSHIDVSKDIPDSDLLFKGYMDNLYGVSEGNNTAKKKLPESSGRKELDAVNQVIYDELKDYIFEVASGERSSTVFTLSTADILKKAKVGVVEYDLRRLMDALLTDYPYEMFWYDKTKGVNVSSNILKLEFTFPVSANYSANGMTETDVTDSERIAAANKSVKNAEKILKQVDENWSDYKVLSFFKEKICELSSYNNEAGLYADTMNYGDPWQMIYVFDEDPNTNVVCEGYSKAFKYLCDKHTFNSDVECYIMTGVVSTPLTSGGHMWNNVRINDKIYLADVTNSDDGSIGSKGELFMAGIPEDSYYEDTAGNFAGGIIKSNGQDVAYQYDSYSRNLYTSEELIVSQDAPVLHTVLWKNRVGDVIEKDEMVADGEKPVYNNTGDDEYSDWSPAITEDTVVSGEDEEIVYIAKKGGPDPTYKVKLMMPDGSEMTPLKVTEGNKIVPPDSVETEDGKLIGWYTDSSFTTEFDPETTADSDLTLYAKVSFNVKWVNDDGALLYSQDVLWGDTPVYGGEEPVKAEDEQFIYTFSEWEPKIQAVNGSTEYKAVYLKKAKAVTVTWKNDDGTVLKTDDNVAYGTQPSYTGKEPTKAADEKYTYTFTGWSPDVHEADTDAEYTAVFKEVPRKYKVTFKNWDGSVLSTSELEYGASAEYNGKQPEKSDDKDHSYSFIGWDKELDKVTQDTEYTAVFSSKEIKHEADSDTDTDTQTDNNRDTASDVVSDTDKSSDNSSDVDSDKATDTSAETSTDTSAETHSDTPDNKNSDTESDTSTDKKSSSDSDTDKSSDTSSDTKKDTDTDNGNGDKTETKAGMYGDADRDEAITSGDALIVLRRSANLITLENDIEQISDVDNDSFVTSSDALQILRFSAGLPANGRIGQIKK